MNCFQAPALSLRTFAIIAIAIASLWCLWKLYRSSNSFDPVDLLIDNGKASWSKISAIGAFVVTSWAVIVMAISAHLSDMMLGIYAGIYSGTPIAYKIVSTWARRDKA